MEGSESEGLKLPAVQLETKSAQDISPQDVEMLGKFVDGETEHYISNSTGPLREELGTSAFVHAQALATLKDYIRDKKDFSLVVAKNNMGEVTGYSLIGLNLENQEPLKKVNGVFLGVRLEDRKKGIGSELMQKRMEVLKSQGVDGYVSDSRNEMLSLYDRLGIKYKAEPLSKEHNAVGIAKKVTVFVR